MKILQASKIIQSLIDLRNMATDEMSLAAPYIYPMWRPGVDYKLGDRVLHEDVLYRVLTPHTSQETWTPITATSLFAKVLIPDENVIPEWEQPSSTNTYKTGDKVLHNGKTWVSNVDNNNWEPGVYGWDEIT